MPEFAALQTQWLMMGLAGGTVVTLLLIMGYLALWEPRRRKTEPLHLNRKPAWINWFVDIPWILIFLFVAGLIFSIAYTYKENIHHLKW